MVPLVWFLHLVCRSSTYTAIGSPSDQLRPRKLELYLYGLEPCGGQGSFNVYLPVVVDIPPFGMPAHDHLLPEYDPCYCFSHLKEDLVRRHELMETAQASIEGHWRPVRRSYVSVALT